MMATEKDLREAIRILKEGKPVVFPTETVYGIGIALSKKKNSEIIYDLKGRDEIKPLSLHIAKLESLDLDNIFFPHLVNFLVHRFWPGPLTLVAHQRSGENLGFRFPENPVARRLIEMLGEPLLATSANLSGKPPATTLEKAKNYFGDRVPFYLDGGKTEYEESSTVLDVTQYPAKFIREGSGSKRVKQALEEFEDFRFAKKIILLVCTGNTCRSPMAEGWLKRFLAEEGYADRFLVESCGTAAFGGVPPTPEAIEVMQADGIDISTMRSRPVQDELALRAGIIFVMTAAHKEYILERVPEVSDRMVVLDVADPIGMDKPEYERVYELIKQGLAKELAWVLKS